MPSPTVGTYDILSHGSVVADSASNALLVGYDRNPFSGPYQTLIEEWNGSRWSIVSRQ